MPNKNVLLVKASYTDDVAKLLHQLRFDHGLLYSYFLLFSLFFFKRGPSISPNKAPESFEPYFLTVSFVCCSSRAFLVVLDFEQAFSTLLNCLLREPKRFFTSYFCFTNRHFSIDLFYAWNI